MAELDAPKEAAAGGKKKKKKGGKGGGGGDEEDLDALLAEFGAPPPPPAAAAAAAGAAAEGAVDEDGAEDGDAGEKVAALRVASCARREEDGIELSPLNRIFAIKVRNYLILCVMMPPRWRDVRPYDAALCMRWWTPLPPPPP